MRKGEQVSNLDKLINEITKDWRLMSAVEVAVLNTRPMGYSKQEAAFGLAEKKGRNWQALDSWETLMQHIDYNRDELREDMPKFSGDLNGTIRPMVMKIKDAIRKDKAEGNAPKSTGDYTTVQ